MSQALNQENKVTPPENRKVNDLIKLVENPFSYTTNFVSYDTKTRIEGNYDDSTLKLFGALQNAYNYFKTRLFNNKLSPVVLTLNRNARSGGYYIHSAWVNDSQSILPEINISPAMLFLEPRIVTSILVHESCHHLQYLYGKPGRGGYHNRQFAGIMAYVGLKCSSTSRPGGKTTGQRMGHYIIEGGRFEQAFNAMPKEYLIPYTSIDIPRVLRSNGKNRNKIKYACPDCDTAVWGKPDQNVVCGSCMKRLEEV